MLLPIILTELDRDPVGVWTPLVFKSGQRGPNQLLPAPIDSSTTRPPNVAALLCMFPPEIFSQVEGRLLLVHLADSTFIVTVGG